jgi:hypothetical protein
MRRRADVMRVRLPIRASGRPTGLTIRHLMAQDPGSRCSAGALP